MARDVRPPRTGPFWRGGLARRRVLHACAGLALVALATPSAAEARATPDAQEHAVSVAQEHAEHAPWFGGRSFWWWIGARTPNGTPWAPSGDGRRTPPAGGPSAAGPTAPPVQPTAPSSPTASATPTPPATGRHGHRSSKTPSAPASGGTGATERPPAASVTSIPTSFPDGSTTGPRSGHRLASSGSLKITQAGAVVSDLAVDGCIDVQARNVTISDVSVDCSRATTAISIADGASATIQYAEIDGNGVVSAAVGFANYTLSHVDIHDVIDGPRMNSNVQVLDSWIHDLARVTGSHNDALQTTGGTGIVVRGNTLQPYDPGSKDPYNAAVMIGSENQPLRNMTIEGNYLDGGNYSILARADLDGSNIVVRDNVFTRNFRYGPYRGATGMSADGTNVYADTRASIF